VHFTTVARWKAVGWIVQESRHPIDVARAALESTAPFVTGIPQTSIDDLIREHSNRESLELTDDELLRAATREVAIALIIIAQAMRGQATSLVTTKTGELAAMLKSVATALSAASGAFRQVLTLRQTSRH
jgi:hypothetical protein